MRQLTFVILALLAGSAAAQDKTEYSLKGEAFEACRQKRRPWNRGGPGSFAGWVRGWGAGGDQDRLPSRRSLGRRFPCIAVGPTVLELDQSRRCATSFCLGTSRPIFPQCYGVVR